MKIRYIGKATVRIIEPYRWASENGYVQDVTDPGILENLLTYPKPDFQPVEEKQTSKKRSKKSVTGG